MKMPSESGLSLEVPVGEFYDAVAALESLNHPRKGRQRRDQSDQLHAKIVWSAWSLVEGGEDALRARYLMRRSGADDSLSMRSDEINSYKAGDRTLCIARQEVLAKRHPRLACVLGWPLGLLSLRGMKLRALKSSMQPFLTEGWLSPQYVFPGDEAEPRAANRQPIRYLDVERLYERGDAYGFFAIAAAYRIFHLERRRDPQWDAARHLIKALPGLCREPCVRPHAEDAITLTRTLLMHLPDTSVPLKIDDDVLWEQINSDAHEPCRQIRLTAAKEGRIIDAPVDPIIHYKYVRCRQGESPLQLAGKG